MLTFSLNFTIFFLTTTEIVRQLVPKMVKEPYLMPTLLMNRSAGLLFGRGRPSLATPEPYCLDAQPPLVQ